MYSSKCCISTKRLYAYSCTHVHGYTQQILLPPVNTALPRSDKSDVEKNHTHMHNMTDAVQLLCVGV